MTDARKIAALALSALVMIALTSCSGSVSVGDNTVNKAEVEKQAQSKFDGLAKAKGLQNFPKITCPDDLEAKTGASEKCSATFPDGTLGITASVTGVDGDTAHLHFQADSAVNQ